MGFSQNLTLPPPSADECCRLPLKQDGKGPRKEVVMIKITRCDTNVEMNTTALQFFLYFKRL